MSVRLHVSCVYLLLVWVLIANAHLSQRSTYAFPQSGTRCWKSCPTAFLSYTISVFVNGLFLKSYCSSVTSAVILCVTRLLVNVQRVQRHLQELKRIYFSLEGAFRGEVLQYWLSSFLQSHDSYPLTWQISVHKCTNLYVFCPIVWTPVLWYVCTVCKRVKALCACACVCVHLPMHVIQGSKSSRLISSQSPAEQMWGLICQGIGVGWGWGGG